MKNRKRLASLLSWGVVVVGWIAMIVSLFVIKPFHWGWIHLILLASLLFITEYFPFPQDGGRVTAHFPLLFTLCFLYSPGVAGLVFVDVLLLVAWLRRQSFSRALFRSGYTLVGLISAYLVLIEVVPLLMPGVSTLSVMIGKLAVFAVVYELVSKGLRDVLERAGNSRYSRWWYRGGLEPALMIGTFLYSAGIILMGDQGRDTDPLSIAFFFSPLVAFSVLSNVIARLARQKRKMELLFSITTGINRSLDLREVMNKTLMLLSDVVHYSYGIVYLLRDDKLIPEVVSGEGEVDDLKQPLPLSKGLSGWVAEQAEPVRVIDVWRDPRCQGEPVVEKGVQSLLVVPLVLDGHVMGVITLGKDETHGFEEMDLSFLAVLASQAVIAMRNARLVQERERRILAEERNRMAREIHDGLAQSVAGVLMKTETAIRLIDTQPQQVKQWLLECRSKLRESLKEIRYSITALRPSPAVQAGLLPALEKRVSDHQSETGQESTIQVKGTPFSLPPQVEEGIYKVCHEALNNAAKHAQAERVRVVLRYTDSEVWLVVQDDGIGFSLGQAVAKAEANNRYGITGMNERAQQLGAVLQFITSPGRGTRVVMKVPVKKEEEQNHAHQSVTG